MNQLTEQLIKESVGIILGEQQPDFTTDLIIEKCLDCT